jgi:hypothetical protein
MSLRIRYNRVTTAGGVEPDTVTARQGVSFSSSAEEGSVGTSQIIVDDTTNSLDYVGRRRIYAYETACQAHNQIVFNGYIQKRWIGRIPAEGQDSDVEVMGRRWTIDIGDTNSLLSRRLITGPDGDRPDETDVARIQWLLDSNDAYLSNPQDNWENPSPYIDTSGPVSMSAANYIGRTAFDVLNDCAQRSGKNWFVRYYEANDTVPPTNAGSYALTYAFATGTSDSSTLRLTNVDADVDDVTTFAVLPDGQLSRDPTRAYSGNYMTYDGGSRYEQSTNVVNLFQRQDAAVNNPFVKTDAEAAALQTRYLADAATEDDRLTFRFICAKQYVNDLREGQRFEGKFSHLSTSSVLDYSTWQWWRCLRRTVTHLNDEFYEVSGEASPVPAEVAATCSYATVGEFSSLDVWGSTYRLSTGAPTFSGTSPHATVSGVTGQVPHWYGDVNYTNFGISSHISSDIYPTYDVRWKFDNGTAFWPCRAWIVEGQFSTTNLFLCWSDDDGVTWTDTAVELFGDTPQVVPQSAGAHRWWGIHWYMTIPPGGGGYFPGWEELGLMLWAGTLSS